MNLKSFLKITGKESLLTNDGNYQFAAPLVAAMEETQAWHSLYASVMYKVDKYEFHLVYAANARYFKYDGPGSRENCVSVFVYDTEKEEAFMWGCLLPWNAKDTKEYIRRYKNQILFASPVEIEEVRNREKSGYSWRFYSMVDGNVISESDLKKATEKVA